MAEIKFKKLAQEIAKREVGKKEVNISQISEILKVTLGILAEYPLADVSKLLNKYKVELPELVCICKDGVLNVDCAICSK